MAKKKKKVDVRRRPYKIGEVAKNMPELVHKYNYVSFDIMYSKAAEWLSNQPECRRMLFAWAKEKGGIIYDEKKGTWTGKNVLEDLDFLK